MKKIIYFSLIIFSFLIFAQEKRPFEEFVYPKLSEIKIPEITRVKLQNGLRVMIVEDHKLPLIKARMIFKAGSVFDPPEKVGLSYIFYQVWRLGGTKRMTGDEMDEFLESRSAYIETYGEDESGTISLNCLKENFQEVFPLFYELLTSPAFREDKIDLAKKQIKSEISRRNDEPNSILYREFSRIMLGKDSPYARIEEYDTVDAIVQKDLFDFYEKYIFPENAILAIWGDINKKEIEGMLKKVFKEWKSKGQKVPEYPKFPEDIIPGIYFSNKEDLNQSYIIMGHLGIQMNNPDYFPLLIANRIFGHGFISRLFQKIRTAKGLTYGISGGVYADYSHKGEARINTFTKSESTLETIKEIIEEVKLLKENGVTEEELERERKSYLNEYVFNFDTVEKIVRRLLTYEFYGYPEDFIQKTKENIEKLKKEDVDRVVKKYWMPEKFIIYVVGKEKDVMEQLNQLGKVNYWDITIPKPKGEKLPEATEETLNKGIEVLKRAYEYSGGEKIEAFKGMVFEGKITTILPQGEFPMDFKTYQLFPEKFRIEMDTPMGKVVQVFTGEKAFLIFGDKKQEIPLSEFKKEIQKSFINLLKQYKEKKLEVQYLREENNLDIIAFKGAEEEFEAGIDKEGKISILRYTGTTQLGFGKIEETFSYFKELDGIKFPFRIQTSLDGKLVQTVEISDLKFEKEMDPKLFEVEEKNE